jgi:hypothetical protein
MFSITNINIIIVKKFKNCSLCSKNEILICIENTKITMYSYII